MIFVLLLLISQQNALNLKKLYRTRGLNAIDVDLDSYDDLNQGVITINIILENNSLSIIPPYLAFCDTNNLQIVKSIIGSPETIKNQIESNKKLCVFDNNALFYQQSVQQIVLSNLLNDENEQVYNKFSIFKLNKKKISIYIYSFDEAQYTIQIKSSQRGECYNQCNNHGQCIRNEISFCKCNLGYLDSTCQLLSAVVNVPSLVQFEMKEQFYQMMLTIPLRIQQTQLQIEVNTNTQILTYIGCQYDKNFLPFYQSNSFYQTEISKGVLNFTNNHIKYCQDNIKKIESTLGIKIENQLILLLVKNDNQQTQVELKLYLDNANDNLGQEIYYILAGALGGLILIFFIITYIICKQKNARRINNREQKRSTMNISDQIPAELYEKIIQEYPGLIETSDCQICLAEFQRQDQIKLTYCLHLFHSICLDEWRKRNETCPFCRENLTKKHFIQQRQIKQLGVISCDAIQIDEQKNAELQKREQRLKHLKSTLAVDSANVLFQKEQSPSQFVKENKTTQQLFLQSNQ